MDFSVAGPSNHRGPTVTACLLQDSSNLRISRKRPHSPDEEHSCKDQHCGYRIVLESSSGTPTDEDSESCHSVQLYETASPKDTSETSSHYSQLDWSSDSMTMGVEFEVASLCDEKLMSDENSSGTDEELMCAVGVLAAAAAVAEEDPAFWADSSDTESTSSSDSEVPRADYWKCLRCKCPNNNPLFRYCEKCYQIRKEYFPERPKKSRRRHVTNSKKNSVHIEKASERDASSPESVCKIDVQHCSRDPPPSAVTADSSTVGNIEVERTKDETKQESELTSLNLDVPDGSQESLSSLRSLNGGYDTVDCPDSASAISISQNFDSVSSSQDIVPSSCEVVCNHDIQSLVPSSLEEQGKPFQSQESGSNISSEKCFMCLDRPKNGIFVHKKTGHIICCYKCSLKVWNSTRRCPLCQQRPLNILQAIVA